MRFPGLCKPPCLTDHRRAGLRFRRPRRNAVSEETQTAGRSRPFLNTRQSAHYLGLSARYLEHMRAHGTGPVFRRHGRFVVYHIGDLDAWSQSRSSASSGHA